MSPELHYPELFGFEDGRPTSESDCYALGMVILEVLSGQVPFVGSGDYVVMQKVTSGETPKRPEGAWFTNDVWRILRRCWGTEPRNRPGLEDVLRCLKETSPSWTTLCHSVPSTANSSKEDVPDGKGTPTVDVSLDFPLGIAMSHSTQGCATDDFSSGRDHAQVRILIRLQFQF